MSTTTNYSIADRLERLRDKQGRPDRGALACLRRGLSETTIHEAWPVLGQMGFDLGDQAAVIVAALYGIHPNHDRGAGNIGRTWLRLYRKAKPKGRDRTDSFHIRFRRLISSDRDEIGDQLHAVIRRAGSESIPVNYDLLYDDLRFWGADVKLHWAKAFLEADEND